MVLEGMHSQHFAGHNTFKLYHLVLRIGMCCATCVYWRGGCHRRGRAFFEAPVSDSEIKLSMSRCAGMHSPCVGWRGREVERESVAKVFGPARTSVSVLGATMALLQAAMPLTNASVVENHGYVVEDVSTAVDAGVMACLSALAGRAHGSGVGATHL